VCAGVEDETPKRQRRCPERQNEQNAEERKQGDSVRAGVAQATPTPHGSQGESLVPPHILYTRKRLSLSLLHRRLLSHGYLYLMAERGCGQRQSVAAQVETESIV